MTRLSFLLLCVHFLNSKLESSYLHGFWKVVEFLLVPKSSNEARKKKTVRGNEASRISLLTLYKLFTTKEWHYTLICLFFLQDILMLYSGLLLNGNQNLPLIKPITKVPKLNLQLQKQHWNRFMFLVKAASSVNTLHLFLSTILF